MFVIAKDCKHFARLKVRTALTSVAWLGIICKVKSHQHESLSWNMPGLRGSPPVGAQNRGNRSLLFLSHINVSLPLSLPPPLSGNK